VTSTNNGSYQTHIITSKFVRIWNCDQCNGSIKCTEQQDIL